MYQEDEYSGEFARKNFGDKDFSKHESQGHDILPEYEPWYDLANAIIKFATVEYIRAKVRYELHPDDGVAWYEYRVERKRYLAFLNSRWYAQLTEVEPKWLFKRVEEKADKIAKHKGDKK